MRTSRKTSEIGATLVEYGLIIALIAVITIPVVTQVGDYVSCRMCQANACILNETYFCDTTDRDQIMYLCHDPTYDYVCG